MKAKSIAIVRASSYDCTPAILRAIEACSGCFDHIEVLDWSRTGEAEENHSCISDLKIRSFVHVAPQRSIKVVFVTLWYQWWLFWHLLFGRYDVIQVCDIMSGMPASVVALLTCKKLIYDIRDPFALCYRFSSLGKKLAYSIDWCVMAMSIKFVLPTDRYIPYLGRWSKGKREVYVIPNTCKDYYSQLGKLDDSVIPPRKDGIVRLAYLGYLDVTRGSQWLLDFCGDTSNNTELIVAGNCRDKELVEKLENTPNVYYTGRLPYADCWSLMRDVDGVTVFYDPAVPVNRVLDPTKFYEAMMVGTPVLISKNMSLNEVVDNNKLGFIIEHNSMDGMSKAVEKLRDISFVKPLRNRCREYYQANLNLDNEMTKYKEFYKRVRSLLRN